MVNLKLWDIAGKFTLDLKSDMKVILYLIGLEPHPYLTPGSDYQSWGYVSVQVQQTI
jgi:hypothetical protein